MLLMYIILHLQTKKLFKRFKVYNIIKCHYKSFIIYLYYLHL